MTDIHAECARHGTQRDGQLDCLKGANIAGFKKVAESLVAYGVM